MECQVIADDAQADLAVAMPALEKAMLEVDKLDKTSITEVSLTLTLTLTLSITEVSPVQHALLPALAALLPKGIPCREGALKKYSSNKVSTSVASTFSLAHGYELETCLPGQMSNVKQKAETRRPW